MLFLLAKLLQLLNNQRCYCIVCYHPPLSHPVFLMDGTINENVRGQPEWQRTTLKMLQSSQAVRCWRKVGHQMVQRLVTTYNRASFLWKHKFSIHTSAFWLLVLGAGYDQTKFGWVSAKWARVVAQSSDLPFNLGGSRCPRITWLWVINGTTATWVDLDWWTIVRPFALAYIVLH